MSYYKSDTKEKLRHNFDQMYDSFFVKNATNSSFFTKKDRIIVPNLCSTYKVHIFLKSEFSFDNLQVLQLHYTTYTKLGTFSFWAISFHEMQSWYYIAIINAFWGVSSSSRHNFYNFWMRNFIMIISLLFCSQRNPQWRYHSYVLTSIG